MPHWEEADLRLECYPKVADNIARPWDAADEYLLRHTNKSVATLVINDRHGAQACLYPQQQNWIDSACAAIAIRQNLGRNKRTPANIELIHHEQSISGDALQVVIKIPKNLDQLKLWLYQCSLRLPAETEFWLAGMAKHIPISWLNWLEQHSQGYQQYRIEKKARLIRLKNPQCEEPKLTGYQHHRLTLTALPGVFARNKLDIGSSVLLPFLEQIDGKVICDLGCGNGLLALLIKQRRPEARVIATDDSKMATRAAEHNAKANQLTLEVRHGNALQQVPEPLDWVVCNPPYHDGHKELTNIAITMFRQAAKKLKPCGKLLLVANRHLPYKRELKKHFHKVELLSTDAKFVVFICSYPVSKQ